MTGEHASASRAGQKMYEDRARPSPAGCPGHVLSTPIAHSHPAARLSAIMPKMAKGTQWLLVFPFPTSTPIHSIIPSSLLPTRLTRRTLSTVPASPPLVPLDGGASDQPCTRAICDVYLPFPPFLLRQFLCCLSCCCWVDTYWVAKRSRREKFVCRNCQSAAGGVS